MKRSVDRLRVQLPELRRAWGLLEAVSGYGVALHDLCAILDQFAFEVGWEALKKPDVLVEFERRLLAIVGDLRTATRRSHRLIDNEDGLQAQEWVQDLLAQLHRLVCRVQQALRCLPETDRPAPTSEQVFIARLERSRLLTANLIDRPDVGSRVETALRQASTAAKESSQALRKHLSTLDPLRFAAALLVKQREADLLAD